MPGLNMRYKVYYVIFVCSVSLVASVQPCEFQFPTLNGTVPTYQEETVVSLKFKIVPENCTNGSPFSVQLVKFKFNKETNKTEQGTIQCIMIHADGKCTQSLTKSKCICLTQIVDYQLFHLINRTDNAPTFWTFSASGTNADFRTNLTFNVLYAAKVTSLSLHEGPVDLNTSVEIVCKYDAGNPPVAAQLLGRGGAVLQNDSKVSGEIRYRFSAVSCENASLIRCQAPGASHNRTATLLVKCPPDLSLVRINTQPVKEANLTVIMRAHTSHLTQCWMTKTSEVGQSTVSSHGDGKIDKSWDCARFKYITGSPPDMLLTVPISLDHENEMAEWRLAVTNESGTGRLVVDTTHGHKPEEEDGTTDGQAKIETTAESSTDTVFSSNAGAESPITFQIYIAGFITIFLV